MDGKSLDITQDKLDKLKELFPEVFAEDSVDWEKLKATLGEDINFSNERYVLNWAGKSDAFRALQTYTTATLVPDRKESVNFEDTDHIFIEGENLEVLKALQKSYYGKVKMIYIDPPYNTGNDHFVYPDRFSESKDEYLKRIGDKDEAGYMTREGLFRKNSKDSGHYHSNWLSMMYPRLFLAKNLLKDDGVIFVSIDDNEVHNLKLMMNEILGEENFLGCISVISNWKGRSDDKYFATAHNYLIAYKRSSFESYGVPLPDEYFDDYPETDDDGMPFRMLGLRKRGAGARREDRPNMYYPIYANADTGKVDTEQRSGFTVIILPQLSDGTDGRWRWGKDTTTSRLSELIAKQGGTTKKWDVFQIDYAESKGEVKRIKPKSIWLDKAFSNEAGTLELKKLFEKRVFDNPKPSALIKYCIQQSTSNDDIILDFFAGSGSTGQAVIEFNQSEKAYCKYVQIQIPEPVDEKSEAYKYGYKTIADIAKERMRRVLKKIEKEEKENKDLFSSEDQKLDLGFKVFKLRPSNFKIWRGDVIENGEELEKQLDAFIDPTSKDAIEENMLFELLLKSGYDLNSRIEKITHKKLSYYSIKDGELIIALSRINEALVKEIISRKPRKVLCLDKLFAGNDQLKTNTVLQMKDAGIEFKTI